MNGVEGRYRQLDGAEICMCLECPVGNRWLLIQNKAIHDRWHTTQTAIVNPG